MKLRTLLFTSLLALAGTAWGATPAPAASTHPHPGMKYCSEHAQECKDNAAKFDQWCSANADKCTALKAWAERRREYCDAHGQECQEHMHKMHEHMKKWCAKNPSDEHCQMMKEHGDEGDMGGGQEPPPPAA